MATPGNEFADGAEHEVVKETTTSVFLGEEPKPPVAHPEVIEEPKNEQPVLKDEPKEGKEVLEEDDTPPELVILYPENGARFAEKRLAFEGEVEPGARVFAGDYEADVTDSGHWRIILILSPGGNLASFTAIDSAGRESEAHVKVYLDTEKDGPKDHEFTAYQKYGSCAEELPYDIWYGTGEPGTKVWIGSEYGSNSTVIGEQGNWDLKVKFPEAPCNDEIQVVLETDDGYRKVFEFIRICEEKPEGGGGHEEEPK